MQTILNRKISFKIKKHLREIRFIESNSERVSRSARRVLRSAAWDLQAQISRALDNGIRKNRDIEKSIEESEKACELFWKLRGRTHSLLNSLQTIQIEDSIS